jgi:SpoVK/Ycf46/Vps4 family AAA+-type ATPase
MSIPITPLDHQKEALDEIIARAKAYYAGTWKNLPIRPRWHSLICGPTGVGKTALAVLAAEATGASLLRLSAPGYMPCGAHQRGTRESITVIAEYVARHDRTMLVLDEIDKLVDAGVASGNGASSTGGGDSWRSYIRGEIYDLADGRWPSGLSLPDDENCHEIPLDILTSKLRECVFIIGIGTFQSWYDHSSANRSMGFNAELNPSRTQITADVVASRIPRELANRFNSDLIKLPDLQLGDYRKIALEAERKLPVDLQQAFRAEVNRRIQGAIDARKGVRFLEECIMQVLKNASMTSCHSSDACLHL